MRAIILTLAATSLLFQAAVGAQAPSLPTPESVLGYRAGADYKIATYDETVDYFQKLDAASDRMTMMRGRHVDAGAHLLLRADLVGGRTSRRSIATARSRGGWRIRRV